MKCIFSSCSNDAPFGVYCQEHDTHRNWTKCQVVGCLNDAPFGPLCGEHDKTVKITTSHITAAEILTTAAGHLKDRAATYDQPQGERSIGKTVAMFRVLTGIEMTEEQGWLFMVCLKMVRAQQGGYRADSYEDGAAYFALAGESAAQERT